MRPRWSSCMSTSPSCSWKGGDMATTDGKGNVIDLDTARKAKERPELKKGATITIHGRTYQIKTFSPKELRLKRVKGGRPTSLEDRESSALLHVLWGLFGQVAELSGEILEFAATGSYRSGLSTPDGGDTGGVRAYNTLVELRERLTELLIQGARLMGESDEVD